ncbi:MAG TPA: long-chain-acyl-CoA synthetase [Aquabacterium sp.]|uniref:long-chain-acyl-CoA synthetase n=1 Tax=Aquabacterium sp. TaxID=1872578 RepID=UPI002DA2C9FC|nr:long-chain-acyl-CoA synthetase [Aquabacterium sp.]HET6788324.1 long-chain-acyl-CoA synthetase [Aquabacterium sp.]HEX5371465.1 long-chain-acyl-CoA synthetase [Aquabacterium sp.]
MPDTSRISLPSLLKGVASSLTGSASILKGLWWLLRLKPDMPHSIGALLEDRASRWPEHLALRFQDRQWTYAQFNAWVNQLAAVLRDRGIRAGDVVGILMDNSPECLACVAATVKLGAVAGMLNHHQRGQVLAHSIQAIHPALFLVDEAGTAALSSTEHDPASAHHRTPCLDVIALAQACATASSDNPPETAQVLLRQRCFYIFTSGTSGLPKASVMTHYRWMRAMAGVGHTTARLGPEDVLYLPLPLYHNNALTISWGAALAGGACLALSRRFSASRFWDEAHRHGATAFCYIGEICRYLLERPPTPQDRSHQVTLALGNGLRADLWPQFQERFGIERVGEFYAASECNLVFVNVFNLQATAGFCPLTYAIIEVDTDSSEPLRDPRGRARSVPPGGVGLLVTQIDDRKPFDGYTDARASEQKVLRDLIEPGDCWFNTGDLVRDQGWRHVQFVDRLGDTFRWKGENVATREVESAIDGFPQVQESVVYGVQVPGCEGRAGMAALRLRDDEPTLHGEALAQHLRARLPRYAVPLFLRLRKDQSVTDTFKHRKGDLKTAGFDPAQCGEPVFVLHDSHQGYVPLTPEIAEQIHQQQWRW